MKKEFSKAVRWWLISGCVLVFFQVVIGGITRISGSGLSITKWEIVTGVIPPLNEGDWNVEFDLYKQTPQYVKINKDMNLSEFKFIYFWEYFHRLWARMMGFIFLFPFMFFLFRKQLNSRIIKHLGFVILAAVLAASMGWIMVASGLLDRPWVNAYKLALHLSVAFLTYGLLIWTTFISFMPQDSINGRITNSFKRWFYLFFVLLLVQLFLGGVMSGLRAGLAYPTWPDLHGSFLPDILLTKSNWTIDAFNNYEQSAFVPALFHVLHRCVAYLLFILGIYLYIKGRKDWFCSNSKSVLNLFLLLLLAQVILGILTLINCIGSIPLLLGILHQAFALLLLSIVLYILFIILKIKDIV